MKKNFLIAIAAIALVSCNENDVDIVTNSSPQPVSQLNTVTFISGGTTDVMFFEDNKVQLYKIGDNGDGTFDLNYSYTYDVNGQLSAMTGTNAQGEIIFERTIGYNEQGRIISKHDTYFNNIQGTESVEEVAYIYNDVNNTITADFTSYDDTVQDRVYHFNASGLLTKITTNGAAVQEMQYEGNNVINMGNYNYVYDNSTPVKGEYINIYRNQFKSYQNYVIYTGYMVPNVLSDKYILEMNDSMATAGTSTYTYVFDDNGYPIEVNRIAQGNNSIRTLITYN